LNHIVCDAVVGGSFRQGSYLVLEPVCGTGSQRGVIYLTFVIGGSLAMPRGSIQSLL